MYRKVAEDSHGEFHFEKGWAMSERLGYAPADLDRIPAEAIEFDLRGPGNSPVAVPIHIKWNRLPATLGAAVLSEAA